MDNKKKLVLGALFVAIFGIGAFQFVGGSSEEPAQAAKSSAKQDVPKTADRPVASVYPPLAARDPFKTERLPGGAVQAAPKQQEQPAGGTQKEKGSQAPAWRPPQALVALLRWRRTPRRPPARPPRARSRSRPGSSRRSRW